MNETFTCARLECDNCCCEEYEGFSGSLNSVDGRSFTSIILTYDEASVLLESPYASLVCADNDDLYHIRTDDKGYCSAFIDGKCVINDLKPLVCRCYPLYLDIMVGLCTHKKCPVTNPNQGISYYEKEIPSLIKLCEFWVSYYKKKFDE